MVRGPVHWSKRLIVWQEEHAGDGRNNGRQ